MNIEAPEIYHYVQTSRERTDIFFPTFIFKS